MAAFTVGRSLPAFESFAVACDLSKLESPPGASQNQCYRALSNRMGMGQMSEGETEPGGGGDYLMPLSTFFADKAV